MNSISLAHNMTPPIHLAKSLTLLRSVSKTRLRSPVVTASSRLTSINSLRFYHAPNSTFVSTSKGRFRSLSSAPQVNHSHAKSTSNNKDTDGSGEESSEPTRISDVSELFLISNQRRIQDFFQFRFIFNIKNRLRYRKC